MAGGGPLLLLARARDVKHALEQRAAECLRGEGWGPWALAAAALLACALAVLGTVALGAWCGVVWRDVVWRDVAWLARGRMGS